jgi:hypothetical protein
MQITENTPFWDHWIWRIVWRLPRDYPGPSGMSQPCCHCWLSCSSINLGLTFFPLLCGWEPVAWHQFYSLKVFISLSYLVINLYQKIYSMQVQ